jgi:hypothetical protein
MARPFAGVTLTRAGLILTATGLVSAASVRHAIDEGGDIVFAYGFLAYLVLILLAVPRRPWRYASIASFIVFVAMYLTAALDPGTNDLGLAVYVLAAAFAYLVSPAEYRPLTVAGFALWNQAFRFFGPDPFVGAYPVSTAVAGVLALVFLVAMLLNRDRVDEGERIRRIGLGLLAVACISRISERHFVVSSPSIIAPDDLWALVVVAVLPILAVARIRPASRDAIATGVALAGYVLMAVALLVGKGYHVDSVAVVHRAADVFVAGGDPYRDMNIVEALRHFGLDPALATHLEDGSDVRSFNYPALSFLVPAPFIALGLQDIRYIYLGEVVLLVLVLIRTVRVPWRPLVAATVVGNAIIARQNVLAGVDPLWALFTVTAFLFLRRRVTSAVLIGLACAARQVAWFFVPFYLVAVWKRDGRAGALRAAGIVAIVFALPNVPFFIMSPSDFVTGVLAPMVAPLESYGVGLIRFATDGEIPLWPRAVYGGLSLIAMAGLLVLLSRNWRRIPNGALVFPTTVLWFAWRSLQNYFSFAAVFALAGDEAVMAGDEDHVASQSMGAMSSGTTPDSD